MQWRKCKVITRDFLMNADCKTAFGAIEESLLWSAEQRAASLAATLACRPDEGPVWIDPEHAKCDGPSALPLAKLEPFLKQMKAIDDLVKGFEELDTSK